MIKIATTIILILVTLIASAQTGKTTNTKVEMGRGLNCIGGIRPSCIDENGKNAQGIVFNLDKLSNVLVDLTFSVKNLSVEDQVFMFKKELKYYTVNEQIYFYQPEDYILEDENLEKWQTTREYPLIKKGYYPVSVKEDILHIYITLSK